MSDQEVPDYYNMFEVSKNATLDIITHAYKKIIKRHSIPPEAPDSVRQRIESELAMYQEAYKIISTPEKRKLYDVQLEIANLKRREALLARQLKEDEESKEKEKKKEQEQPKEKTGSKKIDPRTKIGPGGFVFNQVKSVDLEKLKKKQEEERIKFIKAKAGEIFEEGKKLLSIYKYQEAVEIYKELVQLDNKNASYHTYLGLAMMGAGWTNNAIAQFKVALYYDQTEPIASHYYNLLSGEKKEDYVVEENEIEEKTENIFWKIKSFFNKKSD